MIVIKNGASENIKRYSYFGFNIGALSVLLKSVDYIIQRRKVFVQKFSRQFETDQDK